GPVGFAGVAEYGNQYFGLKPDPLSLDGSYYGLHNAVAVGSRDHSGLGVEFSVPVFSQLMLTTAGRYTNTSTAPTRRASSPMRWASNIALSRRCCCAARWARASAHLIFPIFTPATA